jgi:hypothetical protein
VRVWGGRGKYEVFSGRKAKTEKLKTETLKWDRKGVLQRLKCCIVTMGNGDDSSEKEKAESRKQKARKHESRSW